MKPQGGREKRPPFFYSAMKNRFVGGKATID